MKTLRRLAVSLLCVLSMHGAWAQLHLEDSSFGANSLVVDTRSGLSWLQLSATSGVTSADLYAAIDNDWIFEGGAYAGYRIATENEVSALIDSYVRCVGGPCGFGYSDTGTSNPFYVAPAMTLIGLFDGDFSITSDGRLYGVMSGLTTSLRNVSLWATIDASGPAFTVNADRYSSHNGLTYMIAPVPEPSTYAMMLAGLAAVGFVARRRRQG